MRCPACRQTLLILELDALEVDYCAACEGVWLDEGEAEQLAVRAGVAPTRIATTLGGLTAQRDGRRRCPRCARGLRLLDGSLRLDGCPAGHGWWFDRGELHDLVRSCSAEPNALLEQTLARFFPAESGGAPVLTN